jgi:hypothetical protein
VSEVIRHKYIKEIKQRRERGDALMENWDNNNLPENHVLMQNIEFVAVTEGTWKRKKNDGTDEVSPKWDFISKADDSGASVQIAVYSSTDREEIKLNKVYDVIAKRAVGKDGTFYGYTLKGFGEAGKPIPKKEPQSRWQKGQKFNAKAEALKAAAILFTNTGNAHVDDCILVAQLFEAYINGEYAPVPETGIEKPDSKAKK